MTPRVDACDRELCGVCLCSDDAIQCPAVPIHATVTELGALGDGNTTGYTQLMVQAEMIAGRTDVNAVDLANWPNLMTLSLRRAKLDALGDNLLASLMSLVSLDLSNNGLTSIRASVFGQHALGALTIRSNLISEIAPHAFAGLWQLRTLDLSHNFIGAQATALVPATWLVAPGRRSRRRDPTVNVPRLASLILQNNLLSAIDAGPLSISLGALDLSINRMNDCSLSTLPDRANTAVRVAGNPGGGAPMAVPCWTDVPHCAPSADDLDTAVAVWGQHSQIYLTDGLDAAATTTVINFNEAIADTNVTDGDSPVVSGGKVNPNCTELSYRVDGQFPPGIDFDVFTGQLSGTVQWLTDAQADALRVRPAISVVNVSVSLGNAALATLEFRTSTAQKVQPLPTLGFRGKYFSFNDFNAQGGRNSIFRNDSLLPPGLELLNYTGVLHGRPTEVGNYTVAIEVADENGMITPLPEQVITVEEPMKWICPRDHTNLSHRVIVGWNETERSIDVYDGAKPLPRGVHFYSPDLPGATMPDELTIDSKKGHMQAFGLCTVGLNRTVYHNVKNVKGDEHACDLTIEVVDCLDGASSQDICGANAFCTELGGRQDGQVTCTCNLDHSMTETVTLYDGCNRSHTGLNCPGAPSSAKASASSAGTDTGGVIGVSLGAVVFLMLVALVAFKVQIYRLKHQPVNVGTTQEEVLATLGLAATQNISRAELGISLLFDRTLPPRGTDGGAQFESELVAALRRAAPHIKVGLQSAKITFGNPASRRVLVVVPKSKITQHSHHHHPHNPHHNHPVEAVVPFLAAKAAKGKLVIGVNGGRVVEASVAVPRRVPREVPRRALTRLRQLGEGTFGEVYQYQLEEKSMPSFFVAAKSIKPLKFSGGADARDALLREAALGALLDHRNVLATVGVCTTPRDVPALLLLSFCSEGTLDTLVAAATPTSMTVVERLTYCAQTLQGLHYIASIRIVHRDVAARNVLLDSTMTAKISDFGMTTALQEPGKEYVRATGNLEFAMRWAAPEVIQDAKYSVQSDVWAFGVLAYEVFASGTLPYADQFDNLTEISSFVKEGGKLLPPSPEACPPAVYDQVMLPCFATDPADRPTFSSLYSVAVKHGAEEDEVALSERSERLHCARAHTHHKATADRSLLGVSVEHLHARCVPAVLAAIQTIRKGASNKYQKSFDDLPSPADASIWLSVESYGKPFSATTVCPRDGEIGSAYVDVGAIQASIRDATAFLSYAWGYKLAEVVETLVEWCSGEDGDGPAGTWIWMDCFTLNQHRIDLGNAATPEELQEVFGGRVTGIGRMVVMLDPWDNPGYVKRAWCLFELYTAIQFKDEVEIDIILSPEQSQSFHDRINQDGTDVHAIDEALESVKSEEAAATVPADLDAIQALIHTTAGGNATIDGTVKQFLRRWFVSQGGIKVAARAGRPSLMPAAGIDSRARSGEVAHVRYRSQENVEAADAASIVSASGPVAVEGAQTATDSEDGGGSNVDSSSPIVARRVVEPWGTGVNPDRTPGVAIWQVTTI